LAAVPNIIAFVAGSAAGMYAWQSGRYPSQNAALAALQQPVDWAVKTPELEVSGLQFRIRATYLTATHFGKGVTQAVPGWIYGPLNTVVSSDMRDYSGQAIDFAQPLPGIVAQNNVPPYPRLQPSNGAALALKTFRKLIDTTGPKWGSTGNPNAGNLLIDDAAVDTQTTGEGTQGMRASVMVHGTMNSAGESEKLGKIEDAVVQVGQRRRWGS
jgi:hypothetical protein